jgi:hypothetical protein
MADDRSDRTRDASSLSEEQRRDMLRVTSFMGWLAGAGAALLAVLAWAQAGLGALPLLLWALALLTAGMGLGFLFGVPKVRQEAAREPDAPAAGSAPARVYQQSVNTNLEDISDWLTKILVGMGLVNLKELPVHVWTLAGHVGDSLGASGTRDSLGLAVVLFFSLTGFLYGYLMTRLFLQGALARAEAGLRREIDTLTGLTAALASQVAPAGRKSARGAPASESAPAPGPAESAAAPVARPVPRASVFRGAPAESLAAAVTAEPAVDLWTSDPHKGFAARARLTDRRLTARIEPIHGSDACRVFLEARAGDTTRPLGDVTFHLHPTFPRSSVTVSPDRDGVARLELVSLGAFTVGAETDGGETRLELDLAQVSGGTPSFYAN